jgi:hypothetical protein
MGGFGSRFVMFVECCKYGQKKKSQSKKKEEIQTFLSHFGLHLFQKVIIPVSYFPITVDILAGEQLGMFY